MVRGLVFDEKRGNILKVFFIFIKMGLVYVQIVVVFNFIVLQMDRYKYVKVVYYGFREILKEEKVEIYGNILIRDFFDEFDYVFIDIFFLLVEVYLFVQFVDFTDKNLGKVLVGVQ